MSQGPQFVGLDVGGTTMKAAVVDDRGIPAIAVVMDTLPKRGQEAGLETMCECIRRAVAAANLSMGQIAAIGVVTPGPMDIPAGMILDPANLKPWLNVPVRDHVHKTFGILTAYQNDANAAAYGEYWVGAGRESKSMVMFTLGTGIGGGIIIDDRILEGQHSHGGELGHTRIELRDGRACGCGRRGCLEAWGSATSVVKRTREALETAPDSSLLDERVKKGEELTARVVFGAADLGDPLAVRIVDETAYVLAVGATNMMHTIDPDMIVFGGGMTAAGDPFLEQIRHYVRQLALPVPGAKTLVRFAALGSDAGFIGAAGCGRQLYRRHKGLV